MFMLLQPHEKEKPMSYTDKYKSSLSKNIYDMRDLIGKPNER